jgi:hypothetical protein
LGLEDTSNIVGIQDYMQKVDRTNTIQVGVWIRSSGAIIIPSTQSSRNNNHQPDITRCSKREAQLADGNGRIYDSSRISTRSTEIKR